MAEIKDVYSLEFNSGQFQQEIQSAIGRIEELNAAMEDGADVADQLAEAQESLVSVLGAEAKGVEQLNQKRNVLVSTQKQLNNESKAGVSVGKQLDATNKQIAVSTGQAANAQKGFGAQLIDGTRKIGQMRRVASQLSFAFNLVSKALPFGLILSFAGPVISFFTSLFQKTDETAENMEKLNDKTLGYGDRLEIIQEELEKLNNIEGKRGKLTEEEKQRRQELTKAYEETANEIIKIEEDRLKRQEDIENRIAEARIKLLGNTAASAVAASELETKKTLSDIQTRIAEIRKLNNKLFDDLEKERKRYNLTGDNSQLLRIQREIDANNALELRLVDEQNIRLQAIEVEKFEKLKQIRERAEQERIQKEKQAEQERLDRENQMVEDFLEIQREMAFIDELGNKALEERNRLREEELALIRKAKKEYEDEANTLKQNLDAASKYRVDNEETILNKALLRLEMQRNEELLAAYGNADAQAEIDREYNKKRAELEKMANKEIIKIRLDFLKKLRDASADDPAALASLNKQISELEVQFEQLNKTVSENVEEAKDKYKELAQQAGQVVQLAADTVFSVLNAQLQGYIDNLDRAVDRSRTALDDIRQNSENFNARQLELEKERLERLEAERERAVEREKNLGQIQVAINAAIAISKAAAEGGGFASAFTIAATLASLIAGLAQARAAAGNAFFHGVEYLERGNNPRGRDTIPAMLNEGERVITTDTNSKYWDVLSAVHNNRIPADVLNSFANAYQQGGLRAALGAFGDNISLAGELGQKSVFVNVAQNYAGMENRLERIEAVLTELPKYMPKTVVQANAKGIFKIVEQRQQRKDYSRNWAK